MKVVAICVAVIFTLYVGLSTFGAVKAMAIPRLPLEDSLDSVGLAYEDVAFTSRDDEVLLKGWYVPGDGDFTIITVHGGFQNRIDDNVDTLRLAKDLVKKGYSLLLFDLRGRGESGGRGVTLSNNERDIGGAVDYLNSVGCPAESIGIMGFCSGAASTCIFASQENIGALVLDGCFPTVRGMITREATSRGIPRFLLDIFVPGILLMSKILYGYESVDPITRVADVSCPILFIHEEDDTLISLEDNIWLFEVSANPADELWEVNGAEHSRGYRMHPAEYVERVDDFFSTVAKSNSH
jgi:pimeloyl-ACP methyl ester carboxylesterase